MFTIVFTFCLLIGISSRVSANASPEKVQYHDVPVCTSVFRQVGNRCLFLDKEIYGSWQEIRDICQDLGGDLPNLSDANFLGDINNYIYQHLAYDASYWVGSNDLNAEGVWQWVNDNSQVKLGTPLWGDLADRLQDPQGGYEENCGALNHNDYYFMHDERCSNEYSLLCEQYDFIYVSTTPSYDTSPLPTECPNPYTIIDGKCLFINTLAKNTWESHKISCESLGGHMAKLDDANVLGAVYDHLYQGGIEEDFWIGASDQQQEGNWFWYDGSSVEIGTPFWGDNGAGPQNPDGGVTDNCAYLANEDHYFFHDGECDSYRYVICQIDIR